MTPVEIMALIVALLAAIKIIILLIKPKSWLSFVKAIYSNPVLTTIVSVAIVIIALFYLTQELTIVQIFAVMFLIIPLMVIGVAAYSKELIALAGNLLKDKVIVKEAWLAVAVWLILIVWMLYVMFV